MKRLFYDTREIEPKDLDDELLNRCMAATDQFSNAIYRTKLKRQQRAKGSRRLPV